MNEKKSMFSRLSSIRPFGFITDSIRNKLLLAFLIIIGLTLAVGLVGVLGHHRSQASLAEVDINSQIARLSLETRNAVLEARRRERDYLLRFRELGFEEARATYVTAFQDQVSLVQQNVAEIKRLENLSGDEEDVALADRIGQNIAQYEAGFLNTVDLIESRGLEDEGLIGQLRDQIQAFEDIVVAQESVPLQLGMLSLRRHEKNYLLQGNETHVARLNDQIVRLKDDTDGALLSASIRETLLSQIDNYQALFNQIIDTDVAIASNADTYQAVVQSTEPLLNELRDDALADQSAARATSAQIGGTVFRLVITMSSVALILGLVIAVAMSQGVTRQVRRLDALFNEIRAGNVEARAEVTSRDELGQMTRDLNEMLDSLTGLVQTEGERDALQDSIRKLLEEISDLAEGDLTVEAEVTSGTIGAIADSFNLMIAQLRSVISRVQDATVQVSSSANEIQVTAEHLSQGSEAQASQIIDTTAAIDEMAISIQQVSENAALSATVAEQALTNARRGTTVVHNVQDGMHRIRDQFETIAGRVTRLNESSEEISEMVRLIGDIADRTSILALNASIQAAKAGEAGRGFASVARDVERLAERANRSAQQIANLVETIQQETLETVTVMEQGTREVTDSSEMVDQASEALTEIEQVSTQLSDLIQSISLASRQQARGSEDVARSMNEMADVTQQTAAGTKQAAASISSLAHLADDLRASVSTFKLPNGSNGRGN